MPTAPRDPLVGLDQIRWSELWAYQGREDGPRDAREVPIFLRALATRRGLPTGGAFDQLRRRARQERTRLRLQAAYELECCLEHQGGLSPATALAIPFIYALLRDGPGDPWQRWSLLGMLALFAVPQPGNLFPDVVDPARDYRQLDPRCFHACADPQVAERAFLAVEAGLEIALAIVHDDDLRVACEAIGVLALFRRRAAVTVPYLRGLPAAHPELDVEAPRIACALIADAVLSRELHAGMLEALGSRSSLIQLAAACAFAIAAPQDVPQVAIPRLLAREHAETAVPFSFGGPGFAGVAVGCLARMHPKHDLALIEALAGRLAGSAAERVHGDLIWLLLRRAFPPSVRTDPTAVGHAPTSAAALTEPQRTALRAIRDHVDLEQHGYRVALERIGAPASRDALSAWLELDR